MKPMLELKGFNMELKYAPCKKIPNRIQEE